jgi:hypothetical protein
MGFSKFSFNRRAFAKMIGKIKVFEQLTPLYSCIGITAPLTGVILK